jgi:hypothetical protein
MAVICGEERIEGRERDPLLWIGVSKRGNNDGFHPAGLDRFEFSAAQRWLSGVRLLLGAEPIPPPALPTRKPGDPSGEQLEAKLVSDGLEKTDEGLLRD